MEFLGEAIHLELEHPNSQHHLGIVGFSIHPGLVDGPLHGQTIQGLPELVQGDPGFLCPGMDLLQGFGKGAEVQRYFRLLRRKRCCNSRSSTPDSVAGYPTGMLSMCCWSLR